MTREERMGRGPLAPESGIEDLPEDPTTAAGVGPESLGVPEHQQARLRAYRYLGVPDAPVYMAIMRLFTSVLLAEWSAHDVAEGLTARDAHLDTDVIDAKLRQLANWGNLLPSPREVRVTSIAEYQRQAARYQLSKIGGRVQREADALLAATEGAREVSRDLLGPVARGIGKLADITARDGKHADGRDMAQRVLTLFLQFGHFASSISDFYASVASVVSRFDLDGDEFNGFKALLVDYLETVVNEVALYTPAVAQALARLWPNLPTLLSVLDKHGAEFRALQEAEPGSEVDQERGRSVGDWEELRQWFADGEATSGAYQLRAAANRALSSLLANLKRINAASSRATSHRRDLLKLARWFIDSTAGEAHILFNAAFGLHSARHLGVPLGEDDTHDPDLVPSTTPWWSAPTAPVPVSLRERGDRSARGRSSRPLTYAAQKQRLLAEHTRTAQARRTACDELTAAASRLDAVRLTGPAMAVLVELLASAIAAAELNKLGRPSFGTGTSTVPETGLVLTVSAAPGSSMTVRATTGDLKLFDLALDLAVLGSRGVPEAREAGV